MASSVDDVDDVICAKGEGVWVVVVRISVEGGDVTGECVGGGWKWWTMKG